MNKIELFHQNCPSDLDNKICHSIAEALNPLIADIFALYVKTKNFHWHITGTHYRDYHLLLDEQSDQIFAMIDVLAERVRKLGETTIQSMSQMTKMQRIKDANKALSAEEMLSELLHDNKELLTYLRSAHQIASDGNDVGTTSILEVYIDETERRIWFLFSTLSK